MSKKKYGFICGVLAYVMWGLLPLYWKVLKSVHAYEILSHRIVWSFVFVSGILLFKKRYMQLLSIFRDKRSLGIIALCSVFISINWFTYIWAVNSNHIVDTSLGYYITPLMNMLFGIIAFKEGVSRLQIIAMAIAFAGVVIMVGFYGHIPWIAIALSTSFSLYGIFKKLVKTESLISLGIETMLVTPIALAYLCCRGVNGSGVYGSSAGITILLTLSGIVTAVPLLFFAEGVRNVKLSTIGFIQYISPTIGLVLGLFVFNEHFTTPDFFGFTCTWVALVLYSISMVKASRVQN